MQGDADIAQVAAAMGEPARARMLAALLGGVALPAGELATAASISRSTASSHLARLADAGLLSVESHGRHRYFRLASADVAHALESLAAIAPRHPVASLRSARHSEAEREARSCYDHLAGRLGVSVTDRLCDLGVLRRGDLALADPGPLAGIGVDAAPLTASSRPATRTCLDWTERRHHVAGALGATVLSSLLEREWIRRAESGRALKLTAAGRRGLEAWLGPGL